MEGWETDGSLRRRSGSIVKLREIKNHGNSILENIDAFFFSQISGQNDAMFG